MPYQTPAEAAPDARTLIEYLAGQEAGGKRYVYRGQTREWPGALLPSLYRRSLRRPREFTPSDPEYELSLRRCGRRFVEMHPDSAIMRAIIDHAGHGLSRSEYRRLMELCEDAEFSRTAAIRGVAAALAQRLQPRDRARELSRHPLCQLIVDEMHRASIRQLGFLQPYGYMLGMTLAQQYGFASELLDFTSDVRVAGFFATHDGPHYRFEGAHLERRIGSGVAVMYRLPSTAGTIRHERIDSRNYYTCPPQLHLDELCMRFEDGSAPEVARQGVGRLTPEEHAMMASGAISLRLMNAMQIHEETSRRRLALEDAVDRYLSLYYEPFAGNPRYYRLLDMEPGTFSSSRLGRQSAVAVIPDELRRTEREPDSFDYATFQAVEDVSHREGFERFYFRHSARPPDLGPIDREYLWPGDGDCFRTMISRVLDPSTPQYWFASSPVPKRIDLVSAGYVDEPRGTLLSSLVQRLRWRG